MRLKSRGDAAPAVLSPPIAFFFLQTSSSSSRPHSHFFLGPDLRGTTYPTPQNCPVAIPPNYWPYPDKPYWTPTPSQWKYREPAWPANSTVCADPQGPVAAPFVAQGVTAKPDIYPFFYAPLPADFSSGCDWLSLGLDAERTLNLLDAIYAVGYAAAQGWAKEQGYC